MASVTKTITETVDGSGNPSVTTSLYFASFEDFMEYERVVNSDEEAPTNILMGDGTQSANIKLGKEYKIVGNFKDHQFPVGTVVRVVQRHSENDLEYRVEYLDGHDWWWVYAQDLEEI